MFQKRKCVTEVEFMIFILFPGSCESGRRDEIEASNGSDILKSQKRQPCTHKHIMHSERLVWTRNQRCVSNQIKRTVPTTRVTHSFSCLNVSFIFSLRYKLWGWIVSMIVNVQMHIRPSFLQMPFNLNCRPLKCNFRREQQAENKGLSQHWASTHIKPKDFHTLLNAVTF